MFVEVSIMLPSDIVPPYCSEKDANDNNAQDRTPDMVQNLSKAESFGVWFVSFFFFILFF